MPPSQLSLQPPPRQKCPAKRNSGAKPGEVNLSVWKELLFSQQKLPLLFIPQNLQHLPCAAESEAQPSSSWAELDQCPQHLWLSIPKQEVLSPAGDTADPGGRTGVGQRRLQRVPGGAEGGTDTFLLPTPWSWFPLCHFSHASVLTSPFPFVNSLSQLVFPAPVPPLQLVSAQHWLGHGLGARECLTHLGTAGMGDRG